MKKKKKPYLYLFINFIIDIRKGKKLNKKKSFMFIISLYYTQGSFIAIKKQINN